MIKETNNRVRYFAFDQLRAIMMMLGLVVHVGSTYIVRDIHDVHPLKDVLSTSLFFDLTVGFVHTFRMPLFFVISGFFTAMLYFEKGPQNMLRNRLKRILYPFIISVIVLIPLYLFAVNAFNSNAGEHTVPVFDNIRLKIAAGWGNIETVHLWFLYYLFMYCIAGWAIAGLAVKMPAVNQKFKSWFSVIFQFKLAPLVFAVITFICLTQGKSIFIDGAFNLYIDLNCFINHGYFFLFGWLLYQHKGQLSRFLKYDKLYASIGVSMYLVELILLVFMPALEKSSGIYIFYVFNAIIPWLLIFGFTGLALRYLDHYSKIGRYISDASYWVYLVHLPLLVYLQAVLVGFHWSGIIKFTLVTAVTLAVALISYNYLVRDTFIGKFLAGKKLKPGLSDEGLSNK